MVLKKDWKKLLKKIFFFFELMLGSKQGISHVAGCPFKTLNNINFDKMKRRILVFSAVTIALAFTACENNPVSPDKEIISAEAALYEPTIYLKTSEYERVVVEALEQKDKRSEYTAGLIEYLEEGLVSAHADFNPSIEDYMDRNGCFEFVYPLTLTLRDLSTTRINNESEMKRAFESCDGKGCFDFMYPLSIELEDHTTSTINSEREMRGIYEACFGDRGRRVHCNDLRGERETDLKKDRDKKSEYDKVIVEPLVKAEDCDYIIAGSICFYKDNLWVATIDFGNGTCDDIATKETRDGMHNFSMKKAMMGRGH
jgi:hypothetical protein